MEILELDNMDIKVQVGQSLLNILYIRFAPPSRIKQIANHFHSSYELHFIPYGEGILTTKNKCYNIKAGDFYLTGPSINHAQKGNSENPMAEYCINFEIIENKGKGKYQLKDHKVISQTLEITNFWYGKDQFNNIELFKKIMDEANNCYIGYIDNIKNYLQQILLNCIRCYLRNPCSLDHLPIKNKDDQRRHIIDLYLQKFKEDISIEQLSEKIGLSARQSRRFFHFIYGMSLQEKVREMRLELAKELLENTNINISQIATKVGYKDPLYFSRIFKKSLGLSPTLYRKQLRHEQIIK